MKLANYSWWIGAIIGAILTLTLTGGQAEDSPGMLIIIGLVSGGFWGWLIGYLIDKAKGSAAEKNKMPLKNNLNSKDEEIIRRDGYYISEENSLNSFIILFTSKGYVAIQEMEEGDILNYSNDDLVQIISEGEALTDLEISDRLTKYDKNGDDISMKFYDPEDSSNIDPLLKTPYPEPITYSKWSGKIIPNGLLLDLEKKEFSYALKDYEKRNVVKDLKFKFVPINMN